MFTLFLACTQPETTEDAVAAVIDYDAGFQDFSFVDHRGKELTATVWYPTSVAKGTEPSFYEPFALAFEGHYKAPIMVKDAPLIAFSHGFFAIRFQSAYLMEHLAREGYVVVAVDHPKNNIFDFDDDATPQVLLERPDDLRSAVDELITRSGDEDSPFNGMVEGSKYVAIGHSFGSHTANVLGGGTLDYYGLLDYCNENPSEVACRYLDGLDPETADQHGTVDERVVAVVPMSPGLWYTFGADGSGLSSIENSLSFIGMMDNVLDYETEAIPTFEQTGSPKMAMVMENTGHYGCTNICDIAPFLTDECTAEGWADISEVQEVTEIIVTAFVDKHLKGIEDAEALDSAFWADYPSIELLKEY